MAASSSILVVKVGGSLYERPDLGPRLRHELARFTDHSILLIPGGGPLANVVRALDKCHGLGEEASHWLALRALSLNARFLRQLLPESMVVEALDNCKAPWREGRPCILDAHAFARADEGRPRCLPHSWEVTSDALAARVAQVMGASRLILLKSVTIPSPVDWEDASRRGWVDSYFPRAIPPGLLIEAVNCRELWH
jgi:aspartokinase-like uncharacterized kinase